MAEPLVAYLHYLFFASALTALATGLLRLFFYSKGVDFYVAPTGNEIASVRRFIHIELGLLALMPLMAVLMARGIGR